MAVRWAWITSDSNTLRSIFINIFGGITKAKRSPTGSLQALERVKIGTHRRHPPRRITTPNQGRCDPRTPTLSDRLQMQPTMLDAARVAVELAGGTVK